MKSGIIGLSQSGKTTVFDALTGNIGDPALKGESRIGTIRVPDNRIDVLSRMYEPQKTIYAQVEYFLPGTREHQKDGGKDRNVWNLVRDCDAFIHVIRNFSGYGEDAPAPLKDFQKTDQDLMLADFIVIEKRMERLDLDQKRGKKINPEEPPLLRKCLESLENGVPLRKDPGIAAAPLLKGYALLSAKPMLVLFNNGDEDESLPDIDNLTDKKNSMVIRAKLEQELVQMTDEEAAEFLAEFNITASAMDRVIRQSYDLLGLISFFTVGKDEVRAWTIRNGSAALDAAGAIHSDIKQGFIRAEVLSFADLMDAGTHVEARKKGTVRLEGKKYEVCDGDIINFRFNV